MNIPELKKLLGRIQARDREAEKELHALLQQAMVRFKAADKSAEETLEFYLADKIEFLIRRYPSINPADRADLKQDTLMTVFTNMKNGKFDAALGDLGGYAYSIARNRIKDYRKKIREKSIAAIEVEAQPENAQNEVDDDERRMIKAAIKKLPERYREVLRLHFFEGLEMNEVSRKLDMPSQKAYNLKNYALQLLRAQFKKADFF